MSKQFARRLALTGLSLMIAGSALAQPAPGASSASGPSVDAAASGSIAPAASSADKPAGPATAQPASDMSSAPAASTAPGPESTAKAKTVTSLARVVSLRTEPASDMNLRLKLVPRMSYATQTFKVSDRSQLEGLSEGSWVRFTSKRQDGVEWLDRVEPVLECKRMAVCGSTRALPAASVAG